MQKMRSTELILSASMRTSAPLRELICVVKVDRVYYALLILNRILPLFLAS